FATVGVQDPVWPRRTTRDAINPPTTMPNTSIHCQSMTGGTRWKYALLSTNSGAKGFNMRATVRGYEVDTPRGLYVRKANALSKPRAMPPLNQLHSLATIDYLLRHVPGGAGT